MSTWIIISWIFVAVLTGINIFVFLKLKTASDQMLKMAFPNAKNTSDALAQMQKMMGGMGAMGRPGAGPRGNPLAGGGAQPGRSDAQLKAAMEMLSKMQKK